MYAYIQCVPENLFSYLSTKTHVVGAQKNHLNETILLSTQIICKNYVQFWAQIFCLSEPIYYSLYIIGPIS